jgi:hypothetical protein
MSDQAESIDQLKKAGWTEVRGTKHVKWRCPCGQHTQVTSRTKGSPARASANVRATIRRCERGMVAT